MNGRSNDADGKQQSSEAHGALPEEEELVVLVVVVLMVGVSGMLVVDMVDVDVDGVMVERTGDDKLKETEEREGPHIKWF